MNTPKPDDDPLVGQTLGSYRILSRIGQGGMGAVYLSEHPVIGRRAAVKVLHADLSKNPEQVDRFFNEARAAGRLRHPAFVDVFDVGKLPDGSAYIVMDYLDGESLTDCIGRLAILPVTAALGIARQIALGVGVAHDNGIVHRDLKPDNVFLIDNPDKSGNLLVKVLDFGIAKLTATARAGTPVTQTGVVLGTPLFMSPEQCRGSGRVDHRADIYGLGCMLHTMLSGRPPFPLEGTGEIVASHIYEPVPPLRSLDPSIPAVVEALVLATLAKKPEDRPQTMQEVVGAIDRAARAAFPGQSVATVPREVLSSEGEGAGGAPFAAPPTKVRASSLTTLRATTTEGVGGMRNPRRLAIGAGGAVLLAIIAFVVLRGSGSPDARQAAGRGAGGSTAPVAVPRPAPVAVTTPTPAPAPPPVAATAPPAPPVPAPPDREVVRIEIESVPPGAEIVDPETQEVLGETPFSATFPRGDGVVRLSLSLDGFATKVATFSLTKDTTVVVHLAKRSARRGKDDVDQESIRKL